jgi:dTDP-4-amino-4,6-dideoxygalactose transaminase
MIKKRTTILNYNKQTIDDNDIQSVIDILKNSDYLTTGPKVSEFETKLCKVTDMKYCIAVSNGTSALHCAINCLDLNNDDEVIVTTISFVASANCIIYENAKPVFVDIDLNTLNIDIDDVIRKITNKTKAIIAVDFAGQLCNYDKLKRICNKYNIILISDASHSLGVFKNCKADLITTSFHPVKNITTGEGGAVFTNNKDYYYKMKIFRNHGVDINYKDRYLHYYNMVSLGYNYRITDLQCALGISQLDKLQSFINRRQQIAKIYDEAFYNLNQYIEPLTILYPCAYHIYVIKLNLSNLNCNRDDIYKKLLQYNIKANVHYKPIHLQPFYMNNYNTFKGQCPNAESIYERILSLPLFPSMTNEDIQYVITCMTTIINSSKNNNQ